tara:strand:+ start:801 stop:1163 length:363 start_codon:yes stop_codon:yes gene_type:complete
MATPKKTTAKSTKKAEVKTETPVEETVNQETPNTEGPKPIGQLFNSINYNNNEDLDSFINKMTPDQGLYILVQAARAAHTRSAFGIEEAETVSKAIRLITSPKSPEENIPVGEPEIHKVD